MDVRAELNNSKDDFITDFASVKNYAERMKECRLKETEKRYETQIKEKDDLIAVSQRHYFQINVSLETSSRARDKNKRPNHYRRRAANYQDGC